MHALARHLANLTVRTAGGTDLEFMKRLYASTRDDLRRITADPVFIDTLIAMQENMQAAGYRNSYPDAEYLILEYQGEAVGRIVINTDPNEMRLVDIALLPDARGKGLGKAVMHALQQSAAEKKLPLALSVHRNNSSARRFYLALGFQQVSNDGMTEQMAWRHPAKD
ncbi:MAG TPA: GNAT family N-acetyltransferase [Noviherbaspirillum sp.]|uniref:GNAT family N-acetyltransferase n=1 Tax=Noviherbaspirillum sp. TaxID=1926288 RepID=UPI002D64A746|nr:GNAT family N-acetyltransferase [Noviherbaspirillum sp.]HYD94606.1 GNAT family N-acetyltransferase [Noviherbaspirillum sp.]